MQNVVSRKALVKIVGRTLTKEVAAMCSKMFNSILRAKDNESMLKFKFGTVSCPIEALGSQEASGSSKLQGQMKKCFSHILTFTHFPCGTSWC